MNKKAEEDVKKHTRNLKERIYDRIAKYVSVKMMDWMIGILVAALLFVVLYGIFAK